MLLAVNVAYLGKKISLMPIKDGFNRAFGHHTTANQVPRRPAQRGKMNQNLPSGRYWGGASRNRGGNHASRVYATGVGWSGNSDYC